MDYRREQLDSAQQLVATEEKQRLDILQRIHNIDETIRIAFQEQQQTLQAHHLDPAQAQNFEYYLRRLKTQLFMEQQEYAKQLQVVQQARVELQKALVQQKSLELLKEKQHDRYVKQLAKEEENLLSEMALSRITRQQATSL